LKRKSYLLSLLLVLAIIVSFFSFNTNTEAAAVGSILLEPEAGWQRIDDTDSNISYIGGGWTQLKRTAYWGDSRHNSSKNSKTDTIRINFVGTKIRIISSAFPNYSNNIEITIDGVTETLSQTATKDQNITLVYEKTGLAQGTHYVEMKKKTSGTYTYDMILDAIDIDATGTLVDPTLEPTPTPSPVPTPEPTQTTGPETPVPTSTPEPTETPVPNDSGRAILVITMINEVVKEYDLSITEVNEFIDWYDLKDAGTGSAKYAFNKTWNQGPFEKRTEYVIFDKILTFEVNEYEVVDQE
jgi:hypothetical protein